MKTPKGSDAGTTMRTGDDSKCAILGIRVGPRNVAGLRRAMLCSFFVILLGMTLHCDSDETLSSMWAGTYKFSDGSGGATGSLSFVVTGSDSIFCFVFSGSANIYSTSCNNSATENFPINGLQFSIPLTTSQGTFTLEGQFLSNTQASGQVVRPDNSSDTVLNWAASEAHVANMSRENAHSEH